MIELFQYYRIAAAFLILLIHQQFWAKPIAVSGLTSVAVPLFAAMAGFLFAKTLDGDFDLRTVILKKAKRILIPYAIWAILYWVANCVILDGAIKHEAVVVPGFSSWILGGTACHLWFLPCLFFVFMVFSIGTATIGISKRSSRITFDLIVLVAASQSQFVQDATSATFAGYVKIYLGRLMIYFALGSLISNIAIDSKRIRCAMGVSMVLIGCGNVLMGWINGLVWAPLLLVAGLILVATAKSGIAMPRWVEELADASMGIYLVHVLFTSGANFVLQKIGHDVLPTLSGFLLSIVLFLVSYLTVKLFPKKFF